MSAAEQNKWAVRVPAGEVELAGDLGIPRGARGVVVFAHGSGSSRLSPRNRYVAEVLWQAGVGTLLMDLLTPEEEEAERFTRHLRFDIPLLARRLGYAIRWLGQEPACRDLPIGCFGASTGAAAALIAAADYPDRVKAVVSRGGRPDLAGEALARVEAPTLFIVGGRDDVVIELNQEALDRMNAYRKLVIVPGATHLFEEPGALEQAAEWAAGWFVRHLQPLAPAEITSSSFQAPADPENGGDTTFRDRIDAGRRLAGRLLTFKGQNPVVLGLPRGGVPVAAIVAEALEAPLDVLVSRKIGHPGNPELAIGAVTARGTRILHDELLRTAFVPPGYLEQATAATRKLAEDRESLFRQDRAMEPLEGKTAILVDDGIATGMTMLAAIADARAQKPARVVVAAPVIAPATLEALGQVADDVVYVAAPARLHSIGQFYEDFSPVSDTEVRLLLGRPRRRPAPFQ